MGAAKKLEKLNPQATARQEKLLLSCVLPEPDHVFVSVDLSAGEPTVICHYSQDKNYFDATFGMKKKAPYYAGNLLKIDDIYLTGMSFSPMHKALMKEMFHTKFGTVSFSEKWLETNENGQEVGKEFLQGQLKKPRKLSKIMVLGLGYSMGPKKMVKQAYDNGYTVSLKEATEFFNNYWTWAKDVKRFGDLMTKKYQKEGRLINQFGYRLTPDKPYKALNYWIQSSVSGLMNILIPLIFKHCPEAIFCGIIHDELLFQCPISKVEEYRIGVRNATAQLNKMLNWRVSMGTGFVPGQNLFTAK